MFETTLSSAPNDQQLYPNSMCPRAPKGHRGSPLLKPRLLYLATGLLSYLAVAILERVAAGLEGQMLRTEVYSIHGFSHVSFGIGLASAVLFLRPRSSATLVILVVLVAGIAWELHEGLWLRGELLDSVEDVMLGILSASAFLCYVRRSRERDDSPN
jgi:hypothetical protein